ncbi:MAG: alpha-glucosidase/alpha-galactosidase [Christensenellales bacterium]|jgi:alpha-galactosidase
MAKRIVFIGAGSYTFTRNLCKDLLTFQAFRDAELVLVDISDTNLELARKMVTRIVEAGNYPAKVICTKDRTEALKGADGVLCTILVGDREARASDVDIPMKYGVSICVGDTRGPSGVFDYLRTVTEMLAICADIEKYCPNAIFLNYTNPMAMLCRTMQTVYPNLNINGLCHSVQGTAVKIARWIGADINDVTYTCAGINHQAFYIDYRVNGVDAYPRLREAAKREEVYAEEPVRFEMFKHLGYFSPEGSGHHSEYVAWFRKRPDLLQKYCLDYNIGVPNTPERRARGMERRQKMLDEWMNTQIDLSRGPEYAAYIFNAVFGDNVMFEFNGNVRNFGLIDNLPWGACVEVPVLASKKGLEAIHVGPLPPQLAILNDISARCEELAIEAALEGDPRKVFYSCLYDPLTSAVLSMQEIRDMVDEMFAASKEYLPMFKL